MPLQLVLLRRVSRLAMSAREELQDRAILGAQRGGALELGDGPRGIDGLYSSPQTWVARTV
ncbi:hypothetical protein [Anaeromyxobacter terrae]|uniref:hypothetical protein n=1 Tax=Anaeromyxobacter terrae TaxID=2925406 RepID=UPI001F570D8D|nr:hypothetical protein [Anaeromyxobacter sp. SG22]